MLFKFGYYIFNFESNCLFWLVFVIKFFYLIIIMMINYKDCFFIWFVFDFVGSESFLVEGKLNVYEVVL